MSDTESPDLIFPALGQCSFHFFRPGKLVNVHKTSFGDVPVYLCRYCRSWMTRRNNIKAKGDNNV